MKRSGNRTLTVIQKDTEKKSDRSLKAGRKNLTPKPSEGHPKMNIALRPRGSGAPSKRISAYLQHLLCVLALMWTGIVNGQPFFFSDTTNYIRAADMAVHIASGRTFSTEWTKRYQEDLRVRNDPAGEIIDARKTRHNDLGQGIVMAGRSPYLGALMYAGYLSSNFWAFILLQALVSYILIILTLKRFHIESASNILITVIILSATTSLPTYNSLLLADAFFSFGILSFVLLASPGKISRLEIIFLTLVLLVTAVAHVHSLAIIIAMLIAAFVCQFIHWQAAVPKRAWIAAVAAIVTGFAGVQITALATEAALGSKPQFVPVLTARFIADGPGKAFIDAGCEGRRFQICRVPIGEPRSGGAILSDTTREGGTYLLASAPERQRMNAEDKAFALAVFKAYPLWQSAMIFRNTVRQLLWIDYDGLNTGCFNEQDCWSSLPPDVRSDLQSSLSGQNAWPEPMMNILLYLTVLLSLVALVLILPVLHRSNPSMARLLRTWVILIGVGMIVNAGLGGAGVEPQYRYQGRLIWLVPLLSLVAILLISRANNPKPHGEIERLKREGRP